MAAVQEGPAARRRWVRAALATGVAVAALAGTAAVAYRVLAPAEVSTPARAPYPSPTGAPRGVVGTLAAAPLVVEGRIRVYATTRQVRADGPATAHTQRSPFWSYRRWPSQLAGVVTAGDTVITRWTDGELVALHARTGRVAWRAVGPTPEADRYTGRRTGAGTVYEPAGLFTAALPGGRRVVLVVEDGDRAGYDVAVGRPLWRTTFAGRLPNCRAGGFTTASGRFAVVDACAVPQAVEFYDAGTGALAARWRPPGAGVDLGLSPLGCRPALSECPGVQVTSGARATGWLLRGSDPARAPGLDAQPAWLVDSAEPVAVSGGLDRAVTATRADTGRPLWTWPAGSDTGAAGVRIVAVQPGHVHLLTPDRWLVTLDAGTGVAVSRFALRYAPENAPGALGTAGVDWEPGSAYADAGLLFLERLTVGDPSAPDDDRYFGPQPVLLSAP